MPYWQYDPIRHQYQRRDTGEYLTLAALLLLKERFLDHLEQEARRTAARLANGSLSLSGWEIEMQAAVVTGFTTLALLGRGGRRSMTPQDVAPIAAAIQHQFDYLGKFKSAIADGSVSPRQLSARASLYPLGAGAAFERARGQAYGVELPTLPGEQQCKGNCRCYWALEEVPGGVNARWIIQEGGESCENCLDNAAQFNPLFIPT